MNTCQALPAYNRQQAYPELVRRFRVEGTVLSTAGDPYSQDLLSGCLGSSSVHICICRILILMRSL